MKQTQQIWTMGLVALWLLAGCSVMDRTPRQEFSRTVPMVLLPIVNHTSTPQAGLRAEAITESLLYSRGVTTLHRYPSKLRSEVTLLSSDEALLESALAWATTQPAKFAITGSVDEWRYKVGIDGEPAVGLSLKIMDLKTKAVVWSGVGGRTGWSREAVSAVAQELISDLLTEVDFL